MLLIPVRCGQTTVSPTAGFAMQRHIEVRPKLNIMLGSCSRCKVSLAVPGVSGGGVNRESERSKSKGNSERNRLHRKLLESGTRYSRLEQ